MRYGSICSGVEAASLAWQGLSWQAAWFAEIEPFACAVLNQRWPRVPNHGDITKLAAKILTGEVKAPDILVGGTPCQAFSVAGLRGSLDDTRGNLTIVLIRILDAIDFIRARQGKPPCLLVWENVPGVLNTKDNAFGCFLGGLVGEDSPIIPSGQKWTDAGCVLGHQRRIAWRVLDAQYFGVPQRRRRVFLVASAGSADPAEILFERKSLCGNTGAGEKTQQNLTAHVGSSPNTTGSHWDNPANPHPCLNQASSGSGGIGASNQEIFSQRGGGLVPIFTESSFADYSQSQTSAPIRAAGGTCGNGSESLIVANGRQTPVTTVNLAQAVDTYAQTNVVAIAGNTIGRSHHAGGNGNGFDTSGVCYTLTAADRHAVATQNLVATVRKLTPLECERLQGMPDNHTRIAWRGKPAQECPDTPRYKAIGNSMAVPVMRWIGQRIQSHLHKETTT